MYKYNSDHCDSIKEKNEYNKPIEVGKQACKGIYLISYYLLFNT